MLTDIDFLPIYDSAECSIINDLLLPALSNTSEYWRGVGYFSSGWLQLTASGIEKIAEKGGIIRFIVSPMLSENDLKAFRLAAEAKGNNVLRDALRRDLGEIEKNLQKDTLNSFAWLLSDGIIEFKFAIPKRNVDGDYHDKVGVCVDEAGNILAFHGSFNDTYKGSLNGEAFSVFKSWIPGQDIYTEEHCRRVKNLWENGNSQFNVYPFEEAIKKDFINLRTGDRPYKIQRNNNPEFSLSSAPHIPYVLKGYQNAAIAAWVNNNFHGIFEMATGTGKTITSIASAIQVYREKGKLFLIIIVPFTHLLEQWKENCDNFGIDIVACYGENPKWKNEFNALIMQYKIGSSTLPCAIVVQNTACSDDFLALVKKIPTKDFMMIADETHYLGAQYLRKALFPSAAYRLGLSATPARWMDEIGTDILYSYYDKVVYNISLDEAIHGNFLTKYFYFPILVELTPEETEDYAALSKEIGRLFALISSGKSNPEAEQDLTRLKLRRAKIIAGAENKTCAYIDLLTKLQSEHNSTRVRDLLVFCAPGTHKNILRITNDHGIKAHEFVHEVDGKARKEILNAFGKGDIEAIISIKCMDEGVDVPSTQKAIFLASTTNPKEFIQRRGRVLRKSHGKDYAMIYDFIVIPPTGTDHATAESILLRELPRFSEFAESAENKYTAREVLWDALEEFDMHMYINTTPWDIYKQDQQNGER